MRGRATTSGVGEKLSLERDSLTIDAAQVRRDARAPLTSLTVTHDVTDAPITAAMIAGDADLGEGGGGWAWILSDLKTLLETGGSLEG